MDKYSVWEKEIMGAVARGWTHKETENKEMDVVLAMAIVKEIGKTFEKLHNESI